MPRMRKGLLFATCACAALTWTAHVSGYALSGRTWGVSSVLFYVNPQNAGGLTQSGIVDALKRAADAWRDQTHANIELIYAGTTSGSSFGLNYKNEVFFRNTQTGYGGETYWWYDGSGRLVDFDTAFYDGFYRFTTTPGTCSGQQVYLDDLAIHEFGHGLGLEHSSVAGATMQPVMPGYCDTTQMTLEADDVAGIERAYPAPAPVVVYPAPPSDLSVAVSSSSPTSSLILIWADASGNESGFRVERSTNGSTFTQVAQLGADTTSYVNTGLSSGTTYYYRVYAYNSTGNSAYSNVASAATSAATIAPATTPVTEPAPAPAPAPAPSPATTASLSLTGKKTRSSMKIDLRWSGLTGRKVDVFRNGSRLTTTGNDGLYTNTPSKKTGTFTYQVCQAKSKVCTNSATISY